MFAERRASGAACPSGPLAEHLLEGTRHITNLLAVQERIAAQMFANGLGIDICNNRAHEQYSGRCFYTVARRYFRAASLKLVVSGLTVPVLNK